MEAGGRGGGGGGQGRRGGHVRTGQRDDVVKRQCKKAKGVRRMERGGGV